MFIKSSKTVILVLSNLMDDRGQLNHESELRARKAAKLFYQKKADFIITTGWAYRNDVKKSIAYAFFEHLTYHFNIPKEKFFVDENSRDTVGDAIFTRLNICIPHRVDRLYVVTGSAHYKRASEIFNFVYGDSLALKMIPSDDNDFNILSDAEINSLKRFRETFKNVLPGDLLKIYGTLQTLHPYYNGQIYPQTSK